MKKIEKDKTQGTILKLEEEIFGNEERTPGQILYQRTHNLAEQIFSSLKYAFKIMTKEDQKEDGKKVLEEYSEENLEELKKRNQEVKRLIENDIQDYKSWFPVINRYCMYDTSRLDLFSICPDYQSRITMNEKPYMILMSAILNDRWTMEKTNPNCVVAYGYHLVICLKILLNRQEWSTKTHALLEKLDWCAHSYFIHLGAALPNYVWKNKNDAFQVREDAKASDKKLKAKATKHKKWNVDLIPLIEKLYENGGLKGLPRITGIKNRIQKEIVTRTFYEGGDYSIETISSCLKEVYGLIPREDVPKNWINNKHIAVWES